MLPVVSGGERETVRSTTVQGLSGPVDDVARTPTVRVRDALATAREEGFPALQSIAVRDLLDRIATAGALFEGEGTPAARNLSADSAATGSVSPPLPFEQYRERVVEATGLPAGWVTNAAHWLAVGLRHAPEALRAQSPTAGLDVYDDPAYDREHTVGLAFTPRVRVLAAAMPANDPTVYVWPALALAMKLPIVVRPSDRDPFTAVRLARALLAAGVPSEAVHVLPGDREVGQTLCREADHALAFGGDAAVAPFRDDPTVETYGPGESVAVLGRDPTDRELDSLARGVRRAGGRACFSLTRVVATDDCDPDALAAGLAERLATTDVGPVHEESTDVPAVPDPERAARIDAAIEDSPGTDVTADYRGRASPLEGKPGGEGRAGRPPRPDEESTKLLRPDDGPARLLPTVLRTPELVPEYPFPFVGVTERDAERLPECLDGAYLGVVVGADAVERRFVRSPAVRKVYAGGYPSTVDLRETHETYLASVLYERTTYDPAAR